MKQFVVMMQRFDTPEDCLGDYYLDFGVNDVFPMPEMACKALSDAIDKEVIELNENAAGNTTYFRDGDCIRDMYGNEIASYTIQTIEVDNPSLAANKFLANAMGYSSLDNMPLRVEAFQIDGKGPTYYTICSHLRSFKKAVRYTSPTKAALAALELINRAVIGVINQGKEETV